MSGFIWNTLVSAIVGAVAAVGTVWYLSANATPDPLSPSNGAVAKVKRLEADTIVVSDSLALVAPSSRETLVEICNGEIFAQRGVYSNHIGAWRFSAQKYQTTPDDPLAEDAPAYGEFGVDESGGGYLEVLSPKGSHAVTLGFDINERGAVVSRNNDAAVSSAQALFLKPTGSRSSEAVRSADIRADAADGSFLR